MFAKMQICMFATWHHNLCINNQHIQYRLGGAVASWFVRLSPSSPDSNPGRGQCDVFLARHFTLTVALSTQVYKWVPALCWGNLTNCGRVTCDGLASHPGGVEILLAASCYRNWDKLRQLWVSHGSKASLLLLQYRLSTTKEKQLTGAEVLRLKGKIISLKV